MPAPFRLFQNCAWLVFALVFAWKVGLFAISVQPIPANDSYFYDGAVIHYLLHGGYYNPSIAHAFPISGTKVFSGYPPLHQLALLGWMKMFGVSAASEIVFHIALFGGWLLVLFAVLRRLQVPAWCINLAGAFLLTITFHDRPDSLAHLMGTLAIYACVRSRRAFGRAEGEVSILWNWLMVGFVALTFCTSLQIGCAYFLLTVVATIESCRLAREPVPLLALAAMTFFPLMLAVAVKYGFPQAWAGFTEHVRETPTLTGLRKPTLNEALKIVRTVPGILVVALMLAGSWLKGKPNFKTFLSDRYGIILVSTLLTALGVIAASMTFVVANTVAIANYLQPIIVAAYLAFCISQRLDGRWVRLQVMCLVPAILLGSVRAVGMSTWGLACAADVNYSTAVKRVSQELDAVPAKSNVVISSAFLYGASGRSELNLIHSDWMARPGGDSRLTDVQGLLALKPVKLILTQYDYHRRFKAVLEQFKANPSLKEIQVIDVAKKRPPDSIKSLQQVVQHVSWAPVIVNLTWN
jgi:hypothetical protein